MKFSQSIILAALLGSMTYTEVNAVAIRQAEAQALYMAVQKGDDEETPAPKKKAPEVAKAVEEKIADDKEVIQKEKATAKAEDELASAKAAEKSAVAAADASAKDEAAALKAKNEAAKAESEAVEKLSNKEKKKREEDVKAAAKPNPEEKDAANEEKSKALKAKQDIQDAASSAKKAVEDKTAEADTAKINKDAAVEIKKGEAEIEVKKETKAKKIAEQKPKAADLEQPWGSPSEVWTANMPAHHLEGYAQKDRKDVKDQQLAQAKPRTRRKRMNLNLRANPRMRTLVMRLTNEQQEERDRHLAKNEFLKISLIIYVDIYLSIGTSTNQADDFFLRSFVFSL